MYRVGSKTQEGAHPLYDASVVIPAATKILLLPVMRSRAFLMVQNLGTHTMWVEFGSARATATLTGTAVTSCSVTNAGFGFSKAPLIEFLGGGANVNFNSNIPNSSFVGATSPTYPAPQNPAAATCVMTGAVGSQTVASITVDNGGSGYVIAPYVFIRNSLLDPNGCADPSVSSGSGIFLAAAGGSITFSGTFCPTDAVAVFGTQNDVCTCKFAP